MDEVIFEEFKGTGNMEAVLSRRLAERRIFPAIDLFKSGTRKEELLLTPEELAKVWAIRNIISDMDEVETLKLIYSKMLKTRNNKEFLSIINS
jgi:transcription termination factor Rho